MMMMTICRARTYPCYDSMLMALSEKKKKERKKERKKDRQKERKEERKKEKERKKIKSYWCTV